jgi:hypothetical protein
MVRWFGSLRSIGVRPLVDKTALALLGWEGSLHINTHPSVNANSAPPGPQVRRRMVARP